MKMPLTWHVYASFRCNQQKFDICWESLEEKIAGSSDGHISNLGGFDVMHNESLVRAFGWQNRPLKPKNDGRNMEELSLGWSLNVDLKIWLLVAGR